MTRSLVPKTLDYESFEPLGLHPTLHLDSRPLQGTSVEGLIMVAIRWYLGCLKEKLGSAGPLLYITTSLKRALAKPLEETKEVVVSDAFDVLLHLKGNQWGPQNREPQEYSGNRVETSAPRQVCSHYIRSIFLGCPAFRSSNHSLEHRLDFACLRESST